MSVKCPYFPSRSNDRTPLGLAHRGRQEPVRDVIVVIPGVTDQEAEPRMGDPVPAIKDREELKDSGQAQEG